MAGNVKGVTSDVENQAAEKSDGKDGERSKSMCSRGLTLIKENCNLEGPYHPIWHIIYVISCLFAVSMDPLFFYVVIIDQDNKCLQMDKTLSIFTCLMRSLTDVILLVHFICEICDHVQSSKRNTVKKGDSSEVRQTKGSSDEKSKIRKLIGKIAQTMSWLSVSTVIDFFALIPLPQLLIVLMFYTMKGSGFVDHKKVLNVLLIGQYLPRIYRIYLSAKKVEWTDNILVKGLYNLILYILASHVLGAFWYFFSIERELSCWHRACVNHSMDPRGCINTFYCDSQSTTARNITFLNEHCPLDTPDGALSPFNFGIFLDSLKNKNTENIKFGKKLFYSFWWGLRNLSNFGTNLTTSTYVWENLFAVLISIVGLLLFSYLIGNMQTYLQMEATKTVDEMRQKQAIKKELEKKIKLKKLQARFWMATNKVPHEISKEILRSIEQASIQVIDADLHNFLFSFLPPKTRTSLKRCLCMKTLKKVKRLQDMDDKMLMLMCDYLKPVTYIENSTIFRMGDVLDCMLIIIEGTVWTYASSDSQDGKAITLLGSKALQKGDFYGEELLDWAPGNFSKLPASSQNVKSRVKVVAFVLTAEDLNTVVQRHLLLWKTSEMKGSPEVKDAADEIIETALRRYVRRKLGRAPQAHGSAVP